MSTICAKKHSILKAAHTAKAKHQGQHETVRNNPYLGPRMDAYAIPTRHPDRRLDDPLG